MMADFNAFNKNPKAILELSDFQFMKKLVGLRNISVIEDPNASTIVRDSI